MSDLLFRLRLEASNKPEVRTGRRSIHSEAADEITRLLQAMHTRDHEIMRLREQLSDQRCPSDVRGTIRECIASGQCGCTNGLVLASANEQSVTAERGSNG